MGLSSAGGGEIVQVQGGHIIRATGRKDRHSKVFTAKGPRDRRVRLSAHTAIQFYDVQDRLGYDRPSKAVDWLMNKAKTSIDKLAELPPWNPIVGTSNTFDDNVGSNGIDLSERTGILNQLQNSSDAYVSQGVIVSQSLGSDSMKTLFPTTSEDNPMSFQSYPHDLISRVSAQNQDLCLSLHSLQDPDATTHQTHNNHDQTLFQGSGSLGFDAGPGDWAEQQHHQHEIGRFTRLMGWASGGGGGSGGEGRGGILLNPHHSLPPQTLLFSQQSSMAAYCQRGTLQSSFAPLFVRDLEDHIHHQHHSSISGIGSESDGFMGFCFPSQIHGELHNGASMSNRASSSSMSTNSSQH